MDSREVPLTPSRSTNPWLTAVAGLVPLLAEPTCCRSTRGTSATSTSRAS